MHHMHMHLYICIGVFISEVGLQKNRDGGEIEKNPESFRIVFLVMGEKNRDAKKNIEDSIRCGSSPNKKDGMITSNMRML